MVGIPKVGKMSRGICRNANTAPSTRATTTTTRVNGRRRAGWTKFMLLGLKDADLSLLVSALRYGHIIPLQLRAEKASPSACRRLYFPQGLIAISRLLLHHIDRTFSTRYVQALPLSVIKQIIRITGNGGVRHRFAVCNIEHYQARRLAAADKKAVVGFVQGHGEVRLKLFHWPGGNERMLFAVNDGDLLRIRDVNEDASALLFDLERFGMRGEFDAGGELGACRVNDAKSAFGVAKPGELRFRVEPEVVSV